MHRLILVLALGAATTLAACGSGDEDTNAPAKAATTTGSTAVAAAKPPTGLPAGHLLYRRYLTEDQSRAAIYAVAPGETNGHAVTHPPAGAADGRATASPDGSRMTFARCTEGEPGETRIGEGACHLFTANVDGSGVKRLSPKCCADENSPWYSPGGRSLTFARLWGKLKDGAAQHSEVFTMTTDGDKRTQLTHGSGKGYRGDSGNPSFSPDGKRIAYTFEYSAATPQVGKRAIFIMDADGGNRRQLTPWSLDAGDFARFSPDGSRVMFRANYGTGPGGDLYTIRPDGSGLKQLTHDVPGMLSAAWSPDGRYIAYAHEPDDGTQPDIWVMKADGTGAARLTDSPQWDSAPTWGI